MPRYKEYNETRLLEKAIFEFWSHGYGATSLSDLTEKMKINKFSFYDAFESKENLLLRTMRYYFDHTFRPGLAQLLAEKDISGYFLNFINPGKYNLPGCYILTITAEIGQSIPEAVDILEEYISNTEEVLSEIVRSYHPDAPLDERDLRVRQLLALCTSLPLLGSMKSAQARLDYTHQVLSLMNMNT